MNLEGTLSACSGHEFNSGSQPGLPHADGARDITGVPGAALQA